MNQRTQIFILAVGAYLILLTFYGIFWFDSNALTLEGEEGSKGSTIYHQCQRQTPDWRARGCKNQDYDISNWRKKTVSVIITFQSEKPEHISMTIHSILCRTPDKLLKEIILVDDFNTKPLPDYISQMPRVKLIHNKKREGLIKSRVNGADVATGDVLFFLDAHCEVTDGWLEPLLATINQDETTLVVPIIDILENNPNLTYVGAALMRGGIKVPDWSFDWLALPKGASTENVYRPYNSPTMAGGLFAIARSWWEKLGKYDGGMRVWGTENVELSVRVWTCGGSLQVVPCSRVGHIFRSSQPYSFPEGVGEIVGDNKIRWGKVWLDQYSTLLTQHFSKEFVARERPDLQARVDLRKELKCKSFDWWLDTVYPEFRTTLKNQYKEKYDVLVPAKKVPE